MKLFISALFMFFSLPALAENLIAAPGTPDDVKVEADPFNNKALIRWKDNSSNELGFRVYSADGTISAQTKADIASVNMNLKAGQSTRYKVCAYTAKGEACSRFTDPLKATKWDEAFVLGKVVDADLQPIANADVYIFEMYLDYTEVPVEFKPGPNGIQTLEVSIPITNPYQFTINENNPGYLLTFKDTANSCSNLGSDEIKVIEASQNRIPLTDAIFKSSLNSAIGVWKFKVTTEKPCTKGNLYFSPVALKTPVFKVPTSKQGHFEMHKLMAPLRYAVMVRTETGRLDCSLTKTNTNYFDLTKDITNLNIICR